MNLIGPIALHDFEDAILELQHALLFVAYFVLVAGLIIRIMRVSDTGADMVSMTKVVFICFFITALIATARFWFDGLDNGFHSAAEIINEDFGSEPFAVSEALIASIDEDPEAEGWGVDRIVNSVYLAIIYGVAKMGITLAALFQVPFYILQYVLKWLGFLFLPIGLSLFIFPSLANIGVKLIANILAVMAWPIGFAITNLAAMGFINDFATASTFTGNDTGSTLYMMSFGSLIMGLIAGLILVIGTLATPTVMFMIFASGAGLQGLTGAATRTAAFATYLGNTQQLGLGGQGTPVPSSPPTSPPPTTPKAEPTADTQVQSQSMGSHAATETEPPAASTSKPPVSPIAVHADDPSGSKRAAQLFAQGQAPKPKTSI